MTQTATGKLAPSKDTDDTARNADLVDKLAAAYILQGAIDGMI